LKIMCALHNNIFFILIALELYWFLNAEGPEHPWLVSAYANNAPHPFASIVGQELFQSGLIPSDTDYRIYRDYGGLPGWLYLTFLILIF
jgi:hypothetical protein